MTLLFAFRLLGRPVRFLLYVMALAVPLACGCSSEPPPPDQATIDEGIKQLNEHRDREWNNR